MAPSAVKLLMENFWRESRVLPSKLECERNLLEGDDRNEVKQLFLIRVPGVSHTVINKTCVLHSRNWGYYKRLLWGVTKNPALEMLCFSWHQTVNSYSTKG